MAHELPDNIKKDKGVDLNLDAKRKILGLNAARLYDIDVAAHQAKLSGSAPVKEGEQTMAQVADVLGDD